MNNPALENINVSSFELLPTPLQIHADLPQTPGTANAVARGRRAIERILDGEDRRLIAIVGPCSIHNLAAASEYARRLAELAEEIADTVFVVMRVYFEKPRSVLGWKGLINDPYMNDTFRIEEGLRMARGFLLEVASLGLPAGTEILDALVPQYIGDLVSWSAIGARTSESQTHRELASGCSSPVGFKNGTDGSIQTAVNAMRSALDSHHFLGVTPDGLPAVFTTTGNPYPHLVLRGGKEPNYDSATIRRASGLLAANGLPRSIIIDCSHANSNKKAAMQAVVLDDILLQIQSGEDSIRGIMLESNLRPGAQPLPKDLAALDPGVSVTDACIGWEETAALLRRAAQALHGR
jgi:phospho-2-dehydro-3-deoxyheptonate aldolase